MQKMAFTASISGRVQMVMYRDFAQRKARSLSVVGEIENQPDGTVSVYAEGEKEPLEKFLDLLKNGSLLSHVGNVAYQFVEPHGKFESFYIKYN